MRARVCWRCEPEGRFLPEVGQKGKPCDTLPAMAVFVALLRAVNVGGTGKLPMSELKSMCEKLGFANVHTYIASGYVLFESRKSEGAVKAALEGALQRYAGKPVGVLV